MRHSTNLWLVLEQPDQLLRTMLYSIIVAAEKLHPGSHFLDRARVEAYGGSGVAVVQYADMNDAENTPYKPGLEPFLEGHPMGVDKRVRIVQVSIGSAEKSKNPLSSNKVSQLIELIRA